MNGCAEDRRLCLSGWWVHVLVVKVVISGTSWQQMKPAPTPPPGRREGLIPALSCIFSMEVILLVTFWLFSSCCPWGWTCSGRKHQTFKGVLWSHWDRPYAGRSSGLFLSKPSRESCHRPPSPSAPALQEEHVPVFTAMSGIRPQSLMWTGFHLRLKKGGFFYVNVRVWWRSTWILTWQVDLYQNPKFKRIVGFFCFGFY